MIFLMIDKKNCNKILNSPYLSVQLNETSLSPEDHLACGRRNHRYLRTSNSQFFFLVTKKDKHRRISSYSNV